MKRRMRSQEFIYGKTKRDTEYAQEMIVKGTKEQIKQFDAKRFANNPRPKYEIFPGE